MSFAVFVHRPDSVYDDRPDQQYQFPRQYLSRVRAAVGDWIIYYEPTKVPETRGYFAVAKVADVVPDQSAADMYLALMEPGSYLEFPVSIPFLLPGGPTESGLLNAQGKLSGRAQSAVRPLSPADFNRVVTLGIGDAETLLPRVEPPERPAIDGYDDGVHQAPFDFEVERERVTMLASRTLRDRVFRSLILTAYDRTCAITGLQLINGGGRAEVAAAHIRAVAHGGPDIVQNGLALSGTAHWMFDRGLIGIADDYSIMVSRHVNDRDSAERLINATGRLIVPQAMRAHPHPRFLAWHRENCFKQ